MKFEHRIFCLVVSRKGSYAKPLWPVLSSHQQTILVRLFWSGTCNIHCSHSPANHTTIRQEHCIQLPKSPSHSLEWPYCQQAQYRRWFTMKHSKADLSPKIQSPICLDYRVCNRATELHERGTCEKGWCVIHWSSRKAKPQSTGCSKARST